MPGDVPKARLVPVPNPFPAYPVLAYPPGPYIPAPPIPIPGAKPNPADLPKHPHKQGSKKYRTDNTNPTIKFAHMYLRIPTSQRW